MPYTITEKILLAHTPGKKDIRPGEFIWAKVDLTLANDITAPIAIQEFERLKVGRVFDAKKIILVPDHFIPAKDILSSNQARILKLFAKKYKIKNYFEVGRMGIEHALLPEKGLVSAGDLVIGADSHTCTYGALGAFSTGVGSTDIAGAWLSGYCWFRVPETLKFIYYGRLNPWVGGKDIILHTISDIGVDGALYKAMEFSGEVIERLGMDDRFTICNMAIEAGGKSGIIEPDRITINYLKSRLSGYQPACRSGRGIRASGLKSDKNAHYEDIKEYDVAKLQPQVACPHSPGNVKPVDKLKNIKIDQVVIGSCTNGRITDLRISAKILKGRRIKSSVRLVVIPATQDIYLQASREGLLEIFVKAGGCVSTPTCGPCIGGHMGVLAKDEVALATTNRNFIGRMGHPESLVYLSNPAVAAASAIKGKITHPEEIV